LPPTSYVRMADGAMRLSHPLGRCTQYTMVSLRPVVTEAELRTHDPRDPGADAPTDVAPRSGRAASPRVARLAARITAGAPTTYDAIRALERWLATHTTYTLAIPPLPRGADAVDQFLFVDHQGFCVQIAVRRARRRRSRTWVSRIYRRVQREGKARGRPRRPSETPRQYLDALSRSVVPSPEQLEVVARVITDAAYAPKEPDEGERARAEE